MFKNLSIKARLVFIMSFMSVMLLGGAAIGLYGISENGKGIETIYEDRTVPLMDMGLIIDMVNRIRTHAVVAASATAPDAAKNANAATLLLDTDVDKLWAKYMGTPLIPEEKQLAEAFTSQWKTYQTSRNVTLTHAMEGDLEAAMKNTLTDAGPKFAAARETLFKLIELQGAVAKQEFNQAHDRSVGIRNFAIVAVTVGLALAAWLSFSLIRAIVRPLDEAVKLARAVAEGDLTQNIDVHSTDEIGQLMQALKDMNDSLVRVVGQVRTGTDTVATASSQIAAGNLDLSSRTEEQASSLEETASSMEELTSTVKQNAENAHHASKLVLSTADIAVSGGEVVGKVIQTMGSIKDSSRKISDIIGVIDSIAFQTNILALNAAVEAARAGEQGRGFAVVASEVRNLAQRSASAAKEIKTLITDSVEQVEAGRKLVDEAGEAMDDIVTSVQLVADIIKGTAESSQEQSAGIEQVNQAIAQMDQVTQQNAALVEEAAAAAESLRDQAGKLTEAVSVFKLEGTSYGGRSASPVRQAASAALPRHSGASARAIAPRNKPAVAGGGNSEWEEF